MRLEENPFYLLGATLLTDQAHIIQAADAKELYLGEDAVSEARKSVLHPRRRIDAEVSWVWWRTTRGLRRLAARSQAHADEVVGEYLAKAESDSSVRELECINVLYNAACHLPPEDTSLRQAVCRRLGTSFVRLQSEDIRVHINRYRAVAGVAAVAEAEWIQEAVVHHRGEVARGLVAAWDVGGCAPWQRWLPEVLAQSTDSTTERADAFTYELIDAYHARYRTDIEQYLADVRRQAAYTREHILEEAWAAHIERLFARVEVAFAATEVVQRANRSRRLKSDAWEQIGTALYQVADGIYRKRFMAYEFQRFLQRMRPFFVHSAYWSKRLERQCKS